MKFIKTVLLAAIALLFGACSAQQNKEDIKMTENPTITEAPATNAPTKAPVAESLHKRLPRPKSEKIVADNVNSAEIPSSVTYNAEEAALYGDLLLMEDGGIGRFEQKNLEDKLEFSVNIEKEGFYRLDFDAISFGGHKENNLFVDGTAAGSFINESANYEISSVNHVYLEKGEHAVALTASWGWIGVRSLTIAAELPPDGSLFETPIKLVTPNADDNTLALMSFLAENYGKTALAGQQSQGDWSADNGLFGGEAQYIYEQTGKRPSVIGLDFINYSLSRVAKGAKSVETQSAIKAWENNAIVTFCWHWNAPAPYITGEWSRGFYTDQTQPGFFKKIMDGNDKDGYQLILDDIDAIAVQLKKLQDAGVPVLWRPLHEASGGWFWWGTDRESYLKLYKLLFERLTEHHGLTNLIWVWNGQAKDWYPGDEYADIIGEDIYPGERVYASQVNKFLEAAAYTNAPKMITLSENGCIFDPDLAKRDGAMWAWWCVWNGEFAKSEKYTELDMLKKAYNSEYVTTLDELPDLKTYPIYLEEGAD